MKATIITLCVAGLLRLANASPAAPASLERVGAQWDAYGNFLSVFRLTNTSERDISYPGYAPSSPLYTRQLRRLGWRDEPSGWCGVGLGTQRLAPHQSATFTVLPPEGRRTWRIGIEVTQPGDQWQPPVVWTPPLRTDSEIVGEAPSAGEFVQTHVVHQPRRKFPYTFTVTNTSNRPLFYGGFREAHVPPIYLNQERRLGRWTDEGNANWCGTGFGFRQLPSGGSISFSIPAQSLDSTWRIGIRFYRTAQPVDPTDAFSPVWWEPLPPRNDA